MHGFVIFMFYIKVEYLCFNVVPLLCQNTNYKLQYFAITFPYSKMKKRHFFSLPALYNSLKPKFGSG